MINIDYKILECIDYLQQDESKFFNGVFLPENEEIFLKNIEKLNLYIDKIQDENIKTKTANFVNKILKHKNYLIYKKRENTKIEKIKAEKEKEKEKELSTSIIHEIKILQANYDFDAIEKLYLENKIIIDKHQPQFSKYWYSLPRNCSDWINCSCKKLLKTRKIENLIHFTNIENLPSILTRGLLPIETLKKKTIHYNSNDELRLDNKLNCTCLSIEYPNKYLLDKFKSTNNKKYCILVFDAKAVLLNSNNKKYYVYCNAARSDAREWLKDDTLCQDKYFYNMFKEYNPDTRDFIQYSRTSEGLKCFLPTNPQAEILYQGVIPVNYIKKIFFEDLIDMENFKQKVDETLYKNIELVYDNSFFTKERDEITWEER